MRSRPVKVGFHFDYLMWLFTRISGIAMFLLALMGLAGALIMGARTQADLPTVVRWAFFPNPNHVRSSDIADIDLAWATGFWQAAQIALILFAGTHAWNGLRMILEDYLGKSPWRRIWRLVLFILWLASLVVAIYLILTSWSV